ncbi:MAG: cell filamentation protein Fic [Flavobacteriaceae bacterium]|nr:MAG: cell filamentation protein Fic [Flavobacteriaceae bacterium]
MFKPYIYQNKNWPNFNWDDKSLIHLLSEVRNLQGKIVGKMEALGFSLRNEAVLETLTLDVLKSSEIEGEILDVEQVRSSLAKRLGLQIENPVYSERNVDGVVDMLIDATQKFNNQLSRERLFDWHFSLFPTGRGGMHKIKVGDWRSDSTGPMQVVSGAIGKEKVHFEAPSSELIEKEIASFLNWINSNEKMEPVIKAGIAHLWFITIHPFEDGNGRVSRAITDMLLARADGIPQRYYSMSSQIRLERKSYYEILEKTQQSSLDVTDWLIWFLNCLLDAIKSSESVLNKVLDKHKFWNKFGTEIQNERQKRILNKLLDGFTGKLTTSKWAKMNKCSQDTALRDIQFLIKKGILQKENAGGRSTNYQLIKLR